MLKNITVSVKVNMDELALLYNLEGNLAMNKNQPVFLTFNFNKI